MSQTSFFFLCLLCLGFFLSSAYPFSCDRRTVYLNTYDQVESYVALNCSYVDTMIIEGVPGLSDLSIFANITYQSLIVVQAPDFVSIEDFQSSPDLVPIVTLISLPLLKSVTLHEFSSQELTLNILDCPNLQEIVIDAPNINYLDLNVTNAPLLSHISFPYITTLNTLVLQNVAITSIQGPFPSLKYAPAVFVLNQVPISLLSTFANGLPTNSGFPPQIGIVGTDIQSIDGWNPIWLSLPVQGTPTHFTIANNPRLTSITNSFRNITSIDILTVFNNTLLQTLDIFPDNMGVPGGRSPLNVTINITSNPKLESTSFLSRLSSQKVIYGIIISNNQALTSLGYFSAIVAPPVEISNNPSLSDCQDELCTYLPFSSFFGEDTPPTTTDNGPWCSFEYCWEEN